MDFADTFCNVVVMLFNMSILPLTLSFNSVRKCGITSAIPCLNCCWNVTMSGHNSAAAGAAAVAADFHDSTRDVA